MSLAFIIGLLIVATLFKDVNGFRCYVCASDELYQDWQITGFPKKLSRTSFVPTACDDPRNWPAGTTSPISIECTSACATLLLQTTDPDGALSRNLWVRGCVDKLLGYDPKLTADFCQVGTIKRMNSMGEGKDTAAQLQYCKTDECNSGTTVLTSASCNSGGNAQQRTCIECSATGDNCNGPDTCTANWCTKINGYLGKTRIVTKGCSPFNLYSSATTGYACQQIHSSQFLSTIVNRKREKRGVTVPYVGTQCYCNDKDSCNGAGKFQAAMKVLALVSTALVYFFSFSAL